MNKMEYDNKHDLNNLKIPDNSNNNLDNPIKKVVID